MTQTGNTDHTRTTRERAARPALSRLLVHDLDRADLSSFDRFYERGAGERKGRFTPYRVRLKGER